MFNSYKFSSPSQRHCQQKNVLKCVPLQHDQPSNTIEDLPSYVHKNENLMQVIALKIIFSPFDLLFSSLDHLQSLCNIHPYFMHDKKCYTY